MIRRINLFLTIFVFLTSCQGQPVDKFFITDGVYNVSLGDAFSRTHTVRLSTIGSKIEYIPLETNTKSLLSKVSKIAIYEPYIFVTDRASVLQFKNDGSFVRQIGSRGQGPGQYQIRLISDMVVDSMKQQLIVKNLHTHIFDFDGNHLKQFRNNAINNLDRIFPLNDNKFIYCLTNAPVYIDSNENSLIILNDHAEVINSFANYHKRVRKPGFVVFQISSFYSFQNNIRFKEFGVDTLYTFENDRLTPYAIFDLGTKALAADIDFSELENTHGKYWLKIILEDSENFYLNFTNWNILEMSIYGICSKTTGEGIILEDNGFQNDLDGGLPFFPRYLYNDSIYVDYVQAFDLRKHVLNSNAVENRRLYGQKYDDLVNLVNNLDDESNPVLIMVKK